jgi:hypothetical protein
LTTAGILQRALAGGTLPTGGTSVPHESIATAFLRVDPNPVTSLADVRFAVPTRSRVKLELYDVVGQKTLALLDGEEEAGSHDVRFTRARASMPDGVYYLRMVAQPDAGGAPTSSSRPVVVVH